MIIINGERLLSACLTDDEMHHHLACVSGFAVDRGNCRASRNEAAFVVRWGFPNGTPPPRSFLSSVVGSLWAMPRVEVEMRRLYKRVSSFGLKTYARKKLYDLSPKLYRACFPGQSSGFVQTAYGVDMVSNWGDATFRMCVFGGHGTVLSKLLSDELQAPFTFLDVGANQGLFSLLAAKNPACVRAIAFEPVPETFEKLQENVRHSGLGERIQCEHAAISSQSGVAEIVLNEDHSGAATMADREIANSRTVTIQTVDAKRIDAMLADRSDLVIKVDVEGFEGVVVPELMKLDAAKRISHLICEIDHAWVDFDEISQALSAVGLTAQTRHGGTNHFDLVARRIAI